MSPRTTLALLAGLVATTACASIMHGTKQDVGVSSSPTSARVTIDNQPMGNTPTVAKLSRKDNHIVKIELDGYQPYEATLTRKTSGWVWGNIVFGGLIGLAVDAISGGLYNLTPEQLQAQLARQGSSMQATPGGIYVVLVPSASASWERIGTLPRE